MLAPLLAPEPTGGSHCGDLYPPRRAPPPANRCLHQPPERIPHIKAHLTGPSASPTPCLAGASERRRAPSPRARSSCYADILPTISHPKPYTKSVAGEPLMLAGYPSSLENVSFAGNFTSTTAAIPENYIA